MSELELKLVRSERDALAAQARSGCRCTSTTICYGNCHIDGCATLARLRELGERLGETWHGAPEPNPSWMAL